MKSNKYWRFVFWDIHPVVSFSIFVIFLVLMNSFFNSLASGFGFGFPYTTFLFHPSDIFADLVKMSASYPGQTPLNLQTRPAWEQSYFSNNPYGGVFALQNGNLTHFHIPPLPTFLYIISRYFIYHFGGIYLVLALTALWIVPLSCIAVNRNSSSAISIVFMLLICFSYPSLFSITRGNVVAGFAGLFIIYAVISLFDRKNIAFFIICMSIAINLRPNAIIFLVIPFVFLEFKKFIKVSALSILFSAILFFFALILCSMIYPDYNISNMLGGLSIYNAAYAIGNMGLNYGSSALGLIKAIFFVFGLKEHNSNLSSAAILVMGAVCILTAMYLTYNKKIKLESFIFIICSCYALITPVFADYHLIIFILLFIINSSNTSIKKLDFEMIVSLAASALILSPKHYIFYSGLSLQLIVNPVILIFSVIFILFSGLRAVQAGVVSQARLDHVDKPASQAERGGGCEA